MKLVHKDGRYWLRMSDGRMYDVTEFVNEDVTGYLLGTEPRAFSLTLRFESEEMEIEE